MPQVVEHVAFGFQAVQAAAGPQTCEEEPVPPMPVPSQVPEHPAHVLVIDCEQDAHGPSVHPPQLQAGYIRAKQGLGLKSSQEGPVKPGCRATCLRSLLRHANPA